MFVVFLFDCLFFFIFKVNKEYVIEGENYFYGLWFFFFIDGYFFSNLGRILFLI